MITREQRNIAFLKQTVRRIYEAIKVTENKLYVEFPQLVPSLPEEIHFIHAQQLLDLYPGKKPKERENEIVRRYGAVFVIGIGAAFRTASRMTAAPRITTTGVRRTKRVTTG